MPSPELVIEGGARRPMGSALRESWAARGTVAAFAERSMRVRYSQAVLGVTWAVLQPVMLMVILAVVLGRLVEVPGGGVPYAAFVLSALVPWTFLQGAVSEGCSALVGDAPLLRKVYFPREAAVLGAVLSIGIDLVIGLGVFAVIGPFLGARVSASWLMTPVLAGMLAVLATGVALALSGLNAYYRDVRHALPLVLQVWLFASPVLYPLTVVPSEWRWAYVTTNPAAGILDGFRRSLALGQAPDVGVLGVAMAESILLLWLGYRLFKRLEPGLADVA